MDIHKLCGILWGVTRFCPQPQVKTKGNTLLHCLRLSVSIRNCHFVTVPEFSEQHTSIGLQLDITLFDSIGYIFFPPLIVKLREKGHDETKHMPQFTRAL